MNVDAVIERIKKAMRLAAKAGTEGEKAAAEAAARRMAEANGLKVEELNINLAAGEAKAVEKEGDKPYRRYGAEVGFAIQIIKEHFGVVIVQMIKYHSTWCRFKFFGVNINIEISKYVYDILMREFHKAHREAKGWGLDKRSFMTGWFMAIDKRLREHPLRNDTEQFAEEKKQAERRYEQFRSDFKGAVKDKKTQAKTKDAEALYRGFEAGSKVSLNRPCEGSASPSPFALGHTAQLKEAM